MTTGAETAQKVGGFTVLAGIRRLTSITPVAGTQGTNATLVPTPTGTASHGTLVTAVANAVCGNGGTPEYRFWVRAPGGAWRIWLDYNANATFNWATTGLAPGLYYLEVDVRNQGSPASYETVYNTTYVLS